MRRYFLIAAALLLVAPATQAAKVKVWHQSKPADFDKAKLSHAVVSNEGTLRLSRRLKPFAGLEATHVWALLEDKKGNLFAATGDGGKVYKVTADGKTSVVYAGSDPQVLCLAQAPDGTIYAGTGPSGSIVRLGPDGKHKVIHEGLGVYVWSLAVDSKGDLYAGTGPKGRIYHVTPEGKANIFYQTKQEHVLCVAVGPDGSVYAGSDKNGLVYRIDAKGKGFVLYQAPQAEVHSLQVTAEGVYVGTSAPSAKRRGGTSGTAGSDNVSSGDSKQSAIPASRKRPGDEEDKGKEGRAVKGTKTSLKDTKPADKSKPAPAPSAPSSGENSLYRIATDGTVREVFREKAMVLSMLRQKGRLLVGTGMDGQLFEVDEATRERSEIARLDHGQVLCMVRRGDGSIVLGTGDPGKLYVLEDSYADSGSVLSEVYDAKIISKWGSLRWQAAVPKGTRLTVAVRSGNVSEPDETWSDWSAEQADGTTATIQAPAARFLQYRISLASDDPAATPALRGIALRYATTNQAPEVTKLEVPNLDAVDLDNPKKLKFKWAAEDPNEDTLTYNLYVRKDGWKKWVLLEDDLEKTEFEWDTTTTPSGVYRLKVVASDRKDNPAKEALTAERISDPFVVCHTPPVVKLTVAGIEDGRAVLEATASSPLVRLTGAAFAVNGKKWVNIFPKDGLFDSKSETFKFKTAALKPGTYVVVVRVNDAAGNTGSGDVVFSVEARPARK
jgi:WD40 repeat protein